MKKVSLFFALSLVFISASVIFAQEGKEASTDKIKILNITSTTPIIRGVETEIMVEVEYDFTSSEEGVIFIGFNTESSQGFRMYESLKIEKGSGTVTLKAKIIPVDWEKKGDFSVLAIVTKTPSGNSFIPSASDTKVVKVEKN